MSAPIHIVGASGHCGLALCRSLLGAARPFVPVVRSAAKWTGAGLDVPPRYADLADPPALAAALDGAGTVVSCAHASHTPAVLAAAPAGARLVLLGSTRKFTRWPDAHGNGVLAGEAAFLAAGRPGVMLHPTMIYGPAGEAEEDAQRLAALLARLARFGRPIAPLPGGGRALIQPIHLDDVTRALRAAIDHPWTAPEVLVIAGPAPVTYADFVRAVAAAAGLGRPRIVALPLPVLQALALLARAVPGLPRVEPDALRRLCEDRGFDIAPARRLLGLDPVPLALGLARSFAPRSD